MRTGRCGYVREEGVCLGLCVSGRGVYTFPAPSPVYRMRDTCENKTFS